MKNACKLYLRQFFLHPYKAFINHIGFAIGLASVIIILLWIIDETGFDKFHKNGKQIFRVNSVQIGNSSNINTNSPFPLAPNLKNDFPEIKLQSRYWKSPGIVKIGDNFYREEDVYLVDPDFINMFNIHFIRGNPSQALLNLNSLLITESQAIKYFGEEDPIGKNLSINEGEIFTVSAVISDPPRNSYLKYKVLGNINLVPEFRLNSWYFAGTSFIMLQNGTDVKMVNKKLEGYYSKFTDVIQFNPYLQNIGEIYLNEFGTPGRAKYVWIFSAIAFFIFLMINFNIWNLAFVHYLKRSKEILMRKVNGASKKNIALQLIAESSINVLISFLLSLILVYISKPLFNNMTGKNLALSFDPLIVSAIISILFFSVAISAFYPFMILKKGKLSGSLNSNIQRNTRKSKIKPALIIAQMTLSILILIGTFAVYKQLNFIRNEDVGFSKESVVYIPMNDILKNRYETIKKEFLAIPEVESVTASSTLPTDINWWISINWEGQQDEIPLALAYAMVDYDYFKTLDIEIMDGRSFTEEIAYDDSISYMISELALKRMGIDNPVGKRITMNHNEFPERFRQGRIIGVFKDIHFSSLHNPVSPLLLRMYKPWLFNILIKYNPHSEKTIMSKISDVLKNVTPGLENEIYFLDSEFDRQYKQEIVMGKLFESFAIITTSIFVLGLLGLIGFITENKTKEIGIRKVNGAKIVEILVLLNCTFIIWVVIAFLIATPIAWYVMHKWLENFAYKTDLSWWIFALAGFLALGIALLTVSWQSWRAATRNPVEALRYE